MIILFSAIKSQYNRLSSITIDYFQKKIIKRKIIHLNRLYWIIIYLFKLFCVLFSFFHNFDKLNLVILFSRLISLFPIFNNFYEKLQSYLQIPHQPPPPPHAYPYYS